MGLDLHLQYAHHTHEEFDSRPGVNPGDIIRAFESFDWIGETKKAEELQRVSPTLSVESDVKDRLIWVSSVAGTSGLEFISECTFPGITKKWFGLSSEMGTVSLDTQSFSLAEAKKALLLFTSESYDELRKLYKRG